jgi:hypothetical protein
VIRKVGVYARMVETDDAFVVLAGSTARRQGTPTWRGGKPRQRLLDEGKLIDDGTGDFYRFAVDVSFGSISGAASQVLAQEANGNTEWKVEGTNTTYDGWKRRAEGE